jgi:hypothetical protein
MQSEEARKKKEKRKCGKIQPGLAGRTFVDLIDCISSEMVTWPAFRLLESLHCAFSWSWMKWSEETGDKNFSSNPVMSS